MTRPAFIDSAPPAESVPVQTLSDLVTNIISRDYYNIHNHEDSKIKEVAARALNNLAGWLKAASPETIGALTPTPPQIWQLMEFESACTLADVLPPIGNTDDLVIGR